MTKKVLSVVLSLIMMLGCLTVFGSAYTQDPNETTYKHMIDKEFFHAYQQVKIGTLPSGGGIYEDGDYIPENVTENLWFWEDDIIAEYNAATTDDDYKALYEKMCEPFDNDPELEGFTFEHKAEEKATIDISFQADKSVVQPGDEVTVSIYVSTNFWMSSLIASVVFDKLYLDPISSIGNTTECAGWLYTPNLHFGYNDNGDRTSIMWPASMQNAETRANKAVVKTMGMADATQPSISFGHKFDNYEYLKYTFKVKDDCPIGTVLTFDVPEEDGWLTEQAYIDATYNGLNVLFDYWRAISQSNCDVVDESAYMGQTRSFTPCTVTVGNPVTSADYTELDAAVAEKNTLTESTYTPESWAAYEAAIAASDEVSRTLTADDQDIIDAATLAITNAKDALVEKAVISAEVVGSPILNSNAKVDVTVAGSPDSIRIVNAKGVSVTFNRADATITTSGDNEVWEIGILADNEQMAYKAYATYSDGPFDEYKEFTITATQGLDLSIHAVEIEGLFDGNITSGKHNMTVVTSTDVWKIQVMAPGGNTVTYSTGYSTYQDVDGERYWSVVFNFTPLGALDQVFRTRATSTSFTATDTHLVANVVR